MSDYCSQDFPLCGGGGRGQELPDHNGPTVGLTANEPVNWYHLSLG